MRVAGSLEEKDLVLLAKESSLTGIPSYRAGCWGWGGQVSCHSPMTQRTKLRLISGPRRPQHVSLAGYLCAEHSLYHCAWNTELNVTKEDELYFWICYHRKRFKKIDFQKFREWEGLLLLPNIFGGKIFPLKRKCNSCV